MYVDNMLKTINKSKTRVSFLMITNITGKPKGQKGCREFNTTKQVKLKNKTKKMEKYILCKHIVGL